MSAKTLHAECAKLSALAYEPWPVISSNTRGKYQSVRLVDQDSVTAIVCQRRDTAIVAFRGSEMPLREKGECLRQAVSDSLKDWVRNIQRRSVHLGGGLEVFAGFWNAWLQVRDSLGDLNSEVILTGHSQGGALATIAAGELTGYACRSLVTFGAPRIGNAAYVQRVAKQTISWTRYVNCADVVPRLGWWLAPQGGSEIYFDRDGRRRTNPFWIGKFVDRCLKRYKHRLAGITDHMMLDYLSLVNKK